MTATPTFTLPAPAKLNLFLHILGRRADGYHELQTVFQFLDWADELGFAARTDGALQLHDELPGVAPEQNLILRAANLLRQHSGTDQGADLWLAKRLPMGGGIGGGSSDAATALLGLNHLWNLGASLDDLATLGLQLGADVPVFVRGQAAFAEGIGEKLTPVYPPELWYLVAVPQVFVSTAEIFSDPQLTRDTPASKVCAVLEWSGRNDCQSTVEKRYPEIRNALILLNKYVSARLTGTGGCIFGSFLNRAEADTVASQLPASLPSFIAKGSNISLLHRALKSLIRE